MKIRSITPSDAEYIAGAKEKGFTDGWNLNMITSAFNGGRFFGFIAEEEGAPVGFITCSMGLDDCDIESVFVDCSFRGKGIAKALLSSAESYIKEKGIEKILLEVKEGNTPAYNLYTGAGFKKISVRKKYYPDGKDALILSKE